MRPQRPARRSSTPISAKSPIGGSVPKAVLDLFAGGSVCGIVASQLGRSCFGIELRAEQVAANLAHAALDAGTAPHWITGDSRDTATLANAVDADLIFSCPPYWNLGVTPTIQLTPPPWARTPSSMTMLRSSLGQSPASATIVSPSE